MCSSTRVVPLGLTVYSYVTLTIKKSLMWEHGRRWSICGFMPLSGNIVLNLSWLRIAVSQYTIHTRTGQKWMTKVYRLRESIFTASKSVQQFYRSMDWSTVYWNNWKPLVQTTASINAPFKHTISVFYYIWNLYSRQRIYCKVRFKRQT